MAHLTVTHSPGEAWLRRLARFCYRRRRAVVFGWIALVAGLVALSIAAAGTFENEFEVPGTESQASASPGRSRRGRR